MEEWMRGLNQLSAKKSILKRFVGSNPTSSAKFLVSNVNESGVSKEEMDTIKLFLSGKFL